MLLFLIPIVREYRCEIRVFACIGPDLAAIIAPCDASLMAIARPIAPEEPVMSATLPPS